MEGLKKIKELIANDATEESLDELGVMTAEKSYEIQNAIIQLRRRLKDIKRAEAGGTLSYQEISQEKGKINEAILDLLHELEGENKKAAPARHAPAAAYIPPVQTTSAPSSGMNQKKVLMIAGAAVVLIALIAIINSSSGSNDSMDTQNEVEYNQPQQAAPDEQAPANGSNQQEFIDETTVPEEGTPVGTFEEDQSTQQQQQFELDTAATIQEQ